MIRNIALVLAATTAIAMPLAAQTANRADPNFVAQLRAALRENPEIILEAANLAQAKQRDAQAKQQEARVAEFRPQLFAAQAFGPVLGNPKGSKTIVELLDYACVFCKRSHPLVDAVVDKDPQTRVVIVMRPVLGPQSEVLARFALAANLQGRFRQTHDALYAKFGNGHQTQPTDDNLREVAKQAGLDFERIKRDMNGDQVTAELNRHNEVAEKMGVGGTPFFVTRTRVLPGAPPSEEDLRRAID